MAKSASVKQGKVLNKKRSQPVSGSLMRYYQPVKKNKPSLKADSDVLNSTITITSTESEEDKNEIDIATDNAVDGIESPPKIASIVHNVWTEKYRPTCDENWIGDRSPVSTLMEFFTRPRRSNVDHTEDDDDDLMRCNDINSNALLLTGNHGWGKTCLVYAIANQCNMKVLEMNCSTRRSGRTITAQLREATQTHLLNVKSDKSTSKSDISKFFIRKCTPETSHSEATSQSSATSAQCDKFRQQIILFDDVDVIFEGKDDSKDEDLDTGFWRSLKQLIRESKVPVILTATDCKDNIIKTKLNDIKLLTVDIPKPDLLQVRNHLTDICAKELDASCDVNIFTNESINRIDALITSLAFDVRKCINQLNFSGECFFAPICVPKCSPIVKRKKKRGRRKSCKVNPLKPYLEAALISDINYISSCDIDVSNLVLDTDYSTTPHVRTLTQQLEEMSIVDQVHSIVTTTNDFIDDSFSSITCRPSLLTSRTNQLVDILPFFSVICQVEANKSTNCGVTLPAERQKTRRRSRLQGLPYFEAIQSFRLNETYRDQLCSTYQSFTSSIELYDSDATDIDE